jgi:hypothetical protein
MLLVFFGGVFVRTALALVAKLCLLSARQFNPECIKTFAII